MILKFSNYSLIVKKIVCIDYGRAQFLSVKPLLHNSGFDKNISNFAYQKVETLKQVHKYNIGVNHKHYFSKYLDLKMQKFKMSTKC